MTYSHSFSPEFYFAEGEPYDSGPLTAAQKRRPASVWQAILAMPRKEWSRLARDVFNVNPTRLDPETVMEKIRETDTVTDLRSPVEVWIDAHGYHTVKVYDSRGGES